MSKHMMLLRSSHRVQLSFFPVEAVFVLFQGAIWMIQCIYNASKLPQTSP